MRICQIKVGPRKDQWVVVSRQGPVNRRVVPLDGQASKGLLIPNSDLGEVYQVLHTSLPKINVKQSTCAFPIEYFDHTNVQRMTVSGLTAQAVPVPKPVSVPVPNPFSVPTPQRSTTVSTGSTTKNMDSASDIPTVSIRFLKDIIRQLPIEMATMIWGPSGVGKSDMVRQLAGEMGYNVIDLRMVQIDPVDIRGIGVPDLTKNVTRWLPPEFFPRKPKTILFLDELVSAPPAIQAVGYQLVLDRRIGEVSLPPDCRVIAAGNRMTDRGVVYRMPAPLANRFVHFEVKPEISVWREWAVINNIDPRLITFLTFKSAMLHKMSPEGSAGPWPSPRTWAFASKILKLSGRLKPDEQVNLLAACVGTKPAKDFVEYLGSLSVPDPLQVLDNPDSLKGKQLDVSSQTVLAISIVENADTEIRKKNVFKASKYFHEENIALVVHLMEKKHSVAAVKAYKNNLDFDTTEIQPPTEDEFENLRVDVEIHGQSKDKIEENSLPVEVTDLS